MVQATEVYTGFVQYFALFGLALDMLGAIIVLGPDLSTIARVFTTYERRRLENLYQRIASGETVTAEEPGFEDLRTAVAQGHLEGGDDQPFDPGRNTPMEFFLNFEEIEGLEDSIEIRTAEGTSAARFQRSDLKDWIRTFTGRKRDHLHTGGVLLFTGFYLQFCSEVNSFSTEVSIAVFVALPFILWYVLLKFDLLDVPW